MTRKPKVSIITPLFNRVELIKETLNSVGQQTYENWEAIVVDDGSTDGSYEYVEKIALEEPRIKLYRREHTPKGASTCRNIGIEKSVSDYIIFLDSDDLLAPHCLQQRVKAMQKNPDCDLLVFPVQYFNKNVGDQSKVFLRYFYQDYLTSFLLQSHWITLSPIWKKDALLKLNGFDEHLTCMQDGELHWRALIQDMKFKVFKEKKYIDSFLRSGNTHVRISNTFSTINLDSKLYAHQKVYNLLKQKGLLTPIRNNIVSAQFLNTSLKYNLIGEKEKSKEAWKMVYEKNMVSKVTYLIGKLFIKIRCSPIIRSSNITAGIVKRLFQPFLPKFLLWPK